MYRWDVVWSSNLLTTKYDAGYKINRGTWFCPGQTEEQFSLHSRTGLATWESEKLWLSLSRLKLLQNSNFTLIELVEPLNYFYFQKSYRHTVSSSLVCCFPCISVPPLRCIASTINPIKTLRWEPSIKILTQLAQKRSQLAEWEFQ